MDLSTSTHDPAASQGAPTGAALRSWRREQRQVLLERRGRVNPDQRRSWNGAITAHLRPLLPSDTDLTFGLYWPFKAEFLISNLMRNLYDRGCRVALPKVVKPRHPLEFLCWYPGVKMTRGVYNIPIPEGTQAVRPDVLVIPVVGFDVGGYRLGYGGGYYDRTLAAFTHDPLTIGVGYELSRLSSIFPQPYDIPLDYIVTEAGVQPTRPDVS